MRGGNSALTLIGALLAAHGIVRWFGRSERKLLYARTLAPGERLTIGLADADGQPSR